MSVLVAGALHLDAIVDAPRLPRQDETLIGSAVSYALGGKGANQAAAAARMGADAAMAGRVGTDRSGDTLLAALDRAGVDRRQVRRVPGASGMSVAIVDPAGEYGAVVVSGVNTGIDAAEIGILDDTRLLLLQNEIPDAANLALARRARGRGLEVMLNAAPARPMAAEWTGLATILLVNRVEAADLTGLVDAQAALDALSGQGYRRVVVTLGAGGLIWRAGAETGRLAAHQIDPVSSHGAGDAFAGALAARLDAREPFADALAFAAAAATLYVATPPDARETLDVAAVETFRAARPLRG